MSPKGVDTGETGSLDIKIDLTAPQVTVTGDTYFTIDQDIMITCSAIDTVSGVTYSPCDQPLLQVRLLDRPLWGRRELFVTTAPSFAPEERLYDKLLYRPSKPTDLTRSAGPIVGEFIRKARSAGLKVYLQVQAAIGYPVVIRPSFTLGGSGGGIAYNREEFVGICERGLEASPTHELLIEESVIGWKEFEMEVVRDKKDNCIIICSIENLDPMGVHTGDSITVAPAQTLTDKEYQEMRSAAIAWASRRSQRVTRLAGLSIPLVELLAGVHVERDLHAQRVLP